MMRRVDGVWAVLLACSEFDDPWHAIAAKCARAPTHWRCNGAPAKCDKFSSLTHGVLSKSEEVRERDLPALLAPEGRGRGRVRLGIQFELDAAAAAATSSGRRGRHGLVHDLALHVDDLALRRLRHDGLGRRKLDLELAARLDTMRYCDLHGLTSSRIHDAHRLAGRDAWRAGHDHGRAHGRRVDDLGLDRLVVRRGRRRLDDLRDRGGFALAGEHLAHEML